MNRMLPSILNLPAELSRACRLIARQRFLHQDPMAKFKRQGGHTEASASAAPQQKRQAEDTQPVSMPNSPFKSGNTTLFKLHIKHAQRLSKYKSERQM
jgi:hypothetical protein